MTRPGATAPTRTRPEVTNLVWIDARKAAVLTWEEGAATVRWLESDVPGHHHSTGHVRHDPAPGGSGGGPPRSAGESHRLEHLARFIDQVASMVPAAGDVLVIGPGTVHEHLAERLHGLDAGHARRRTVGAESCGPSTERQLVARLRGLAGAPARRRTRATAPRMEARVRRASGALGRASGRAFERDAHRRPELVPALEGEADLDEALKEDALADTEDADEPVRAGAIGTSGDVVFVGEDPGESSSA
jgi:hypothetical protein